MGIWSHGKFRKILREKCFQRSVHLMMVGEQYTSKTCSRCGKLNWGLGSSEIFHCNFCNSTFHRYISISYLYISSIEIIIIWPSILIFEI
jgi:ribosomal protein L37AE/L43A